MGDISRFFSLHEFAKSEIADKYSINNWPRGDVVCNIKRLCVNVLDKVRDMACGPIVITSGYRCCELNYKVRGAPNSDHIYGQAADFGPGYPVDNLQLWLDTIYYKIIDSDIEFHQLIREPTWLHISFHIDNARVYWRNDGTEPEAA